MKLTNGENFHVFVYSCQLFDVDQTQNIIFFTPTALRATPPELIMQINNLGLF